MTVQALGSFSKFIFSFLLGKDYSLNKYFYNSWISSQRHGKKNSFEKIP